jgi:dephospho-CoA kinase
MLRVGLTGGIASGKTTISNLFAQLIVPVIDADVISHRLMQPGQAAFQKTIEHFGPEIVLSDGNLDRKKLRQQVFQNPQQKKWLEDMLHPLIRQQILNKIEALGDTDYSLIVVPLMFETGFDQLMDKIIAIDCSAETQKSRLMMRDKIDKKLVEKMLQSQLPNRDRLNRADFVFSNSDNQNPMPQVQKLHQQLLQLADDSSR